MKMLKARPIALAAILFIDFGSAPGSESELTIESIQERADATSEVLKRIMQRSVQPQRWGINE